MDFMRRKTRRVGWTVAVRKSSLGALPAVAEGWCVMRRVLRDHPFLLIGVSLPLLGTLLAASAGSRPGGGRCSLIPLVPFRAPDEVVFVGSALWDTLLAGPGAVEYTTGEGHSGYGRSREVYGQLVGVDRVGKPWQGDISSDVREVVLVPWDYAPDCRPVIWGLSAQWVEPGTEGVYRGALRDPSHWADGRPTLDVRGPEFVPYPVAKRLRDRFAWGGRNADSVRGELTPHEALDLFEVLPTHDSLRADPLTAIQPAEAWASANPELRERWPARGLLRFLRRSAERELVLAQKVPVAGTYRFVVRTSDRDSVVFYSRTAARPTSTLRRFGDTDDPDAELPVVGYYFPTRWARTLEDLPNRPRPMQGEYYAISLVPVFESRDSAVWRGDGHVQQPANSLIESRAIHRAIAALNLRAPEFRYVPAFWITYPDGSVRFEWNGVRDGQVVVTVRGERISLDTLRSAR
jgi:hypothetical protein